MPFGSLRGSNLEDLGLPQDTHLAIAGCQKVGIGISGFSVERMKRNMHGAY